MANPAVKNRCETEKVDGGWISPSVMPKERGKKTSANHLQNKIELQRLSNSISIACISIFMSSQVSRFLSGARSR